MKYRNVLATTALLGMLAVTGCSRGALPENNEANYNGERLVRSVSRHTHDVENRVENAAERTTRGITRGINRNRQAQSGNRQNRYSGIRTNERANERANERTNATNHQERTNPINRNTRGLNRTTDNYHEENRRDFANEAHHDAARNRAGAHHNANHRNHVTDRTHRMDTPDYVLHDADYGHSIPVSLTDEGTANFFKKSTKTTEPAPSTVPNAPTTQPIQ